MAVTMNLKNRKLESQKGNMDMFTYLKDVLKIKRLRTSPSNHLGLCPFHDDSNRSFGISNSYPHAWGCLLPHCQKGSSLVTLTMKAKDCSYEKAEEIVETYMGYIKKLSEMTLDIPYYEEEDDYTLDKELLIDYSCGYSTHPYFFRRGLNEDMMYKFKAGYDRHRRRIVFPIFQDGQLINFVGRTIDKDVEPKYLIYEDLDRTTFMFGEHVLPRRKLPYLNVYEGILETVYSHQNGEENCVSLLGAFVTKKHVERMLRYTDTILWWLDNDGAGIATTEKGVALTRELGGQARVIRHLSTDKNVKKDLLDYKSKRTMDIMRKLALSRLTID
jgi:DNA primase